MSDKAEPADFEKALAELEALVARLERGDLPLDEALKTFERGIVEILLSSSGGPQLAPFSAPDEDLSESAAE